MISLAIAEGKPKRPLTQTWLTIQSPDDGTRCSVGSGALRMLVALTNAGGWVASFEQLTVLSGQQAVPQPRRSKWAKQLRVAHLIGVGPRTRDRWGSGSFRAATCTTTGALLGSLLGSGYWIDTEAELRPGYVSWFAGEEDSQWCVAISRTGHEQWEVAGPFWHDPKLKLYTSAPPSRPAPSLPECRFAITGDLYGFGPVLTHTYSTLGAMA